MPKEISSASTETPKEKIGTQDLEIKFVRVPDFMMYYCNSVQISAGDADIQFFFGQTLAPLAGEKGKGVTSTQQFGVAINIPHAKRVLRLLDRQIRVAELMIEQKEKEQLASTATEVP